jgi:hypothetical protein
MNEAIRKRAECHGKGLGAYFNYAQEDYARDVPYLLAQLAETQAELARLRDFLEEAVDLISELHGRPGWAEYQSSPEMQRFRAALTPVDFKTAMKGVADFKAGRVKPWSEVKRELDL